MSKFKEAQDSFSEILETLGPKKVFGYSEGRWCFAFTHDNDVFVLNSRFNGGDLPDGTLRVEEFHLSPEKESLTLLSFCGVEPFHENLADRKVLENPDMSEIREANEDDWLTLSRLLASGVTTARKLSSE